MYIPFITQQQLTPSMSQKKAFGFSSIQALIRDRAGSASSETACFKQVDGKWTPARWDGFYRDIMKTAAVFYDCGIRKGDHIAIIANTSKDWQVFEIAGWMLGAVIVCVDPHGSIDYCRSVLSLSQPGLVVVDDLERMTDIALTFDFQILSSARLCQLSSEAEMLKNIPVVKQDDPALLIFTSGTTGDPKGIVCTHARLLCACQSIANRFPSVGKGDRIISWLPMAHLFQQMMNLLALGTGMNIYYSENPKEIMTSIKEIRPTIFTSVPRFYEKIHDAVQEKLAKAPKWFGGILKSAFNYTRQTMVMKLQNQTIPLLRRAFTTMIGMTLFRSIRNIFGGKMQLLFSGSAPLSEHIQKFYQSIDMTVLIAYGLSENTVVIACSTKDEYRLGSVGKAFPENEIRFARDGEILVKGPGLFNGYYQNTEASRIDTNGFYHTGDLGYQDEDGYIYLRGRKSEMIKTSTGHRISPIKLESKLTRSHLIEQAVVVGDGRKFLAALLVPVTDDDSQSLPTRISEELSDINRELPEHEQIGAFHLLPEPLSIGSGELTSSLKYRRGFIEEKYNRNIRNLYQQDTLLVSRKVSA